MRIVSGMRRGMKLKPPTGMDTRPTTDRVKESVFNLIQFILPADSVLDLFAGSGALGIEALSRGSKHCTFIDNHSSAVALVSENLQSAKFEACSTIKKIDALQFLDQTELQFDLIFLDPPYNQGLIDPILKSIHKNKRLAPGGLVVIETEKGGESVPDIYYPVRKLTTYGKTQITLLQEV